MAPKLTLRKPDAAMFRGWTFVVVLGLVLAVLALIDRGGVGDGSAGCQFEVAVAELDVRSGPGADTALAEVLRRGDQVDGTNVVVDGFRQLGDDQWAADRLLDPVPGSECA